MVRRITPLWLAHHYPEDYDRCVVVAGRHVCRRCLALYPLALVVLVATAGWRPPLALDVALVAGLPLLGVAEFVAEHLGAVAHHARRQVLATLPVGVGAGRGLARYLDDHLDPLFWSVVVLYGAVCAAAAWVRQRRTV
jgi:peptidoglycan/LPS O-acetylase OafA/YrhL